MSTGASTGTGTSTGGALAAEARHAGRVLASGWRVCGRGGWIGAGLLGALLALSAGLLLVPTGVAWLPDAGLRRLLLIVSLGLSALIAVAFWMRLVVNVMQQNQPQLARTLPGQVRALRAALCGVALLPGGVAALVSLSLGGPWLTVLAAVLAMLLLLAAVLRWPMWGFGVMALSWSAPWLESNRAAQGLVRGVQAWPGLTGAVVVALSLLFLARVVMAGGLRHAAAHRRVSAMAGALRGDFLAQAALRKGEAQGAGNPGLLLARGLYGHWLRRALRRPGASLRARLALGLGPQLHWTGLVGVLLVASVFIVVPLLLLVWASPQAPAARGTGLSMVIMTPLMTLAVAVGWPPGLWATRREQALLRLLPGTPQGGALNRWLAGHLARQFLPVGVLTAVVGVVCIRRYDLDFQWAPVEDFVLGCTALSPFMLLLLWRDWSALPPPTGSLQVLTLGAVLGVAGTAWVWVEPLQGHWWTLAGLSALLFAPLGLWRWRVALRAPAAWPVGRLSDGGPAHAS